MPRLRVLEAEFLQLDTPACFTRLGDKRTPEANGLLFLCPKCFVANGGPIGTHSVICWFAGVPQTIDPKPGRWMPVGTSIDDLSFVPWNDGVKQYSRSVALTGGGCAWHGFVTNGSAD